MFRAPPNIALSLPMIFSPQSVENPPSEEAQLLDSFLQSYSVPNELRENAVAKLLNGEQLDSDNPNATPAEIKTSTVRGERLTVFYYADGSVKTSTVPLFEKGNSGPSLFYVTNCKYSGSGSFGAVWSNCLAKETHYYGTLGIYFNYEYARNGHQSITKYWTPMADSKHGHSNVRVERISSTQIRVRSDFRKSSSGNSTTVWMDVVVNKSNATTNWGSL